MVARSWPTLNDAFVTVQAMPACWNSVVEDAIAPEDEAQDVIGNGIRDRCGCHDSAGLPEDTLQDRVHVGCNTWRPITLQGQFQ